MEELNNCPVCEQVRFKEYITCIDNTVSRETFKIVQCKNCGFRFTNPRPEEKEIGKYYEAEEYISHSDTSLGIVNKLYQLVRNYTIGQKVKLINKLCSQTMDDGRKIQIKNSESNSSLSSSVRGHWLLDIGCGTAEFLHACKQNGWNVTGIEPSEVARRNAEQKYNISPLPQERLFELNKKQFNVITLWHVLEHVHQLGRTADQITKLLADGGVLIVAVPNCNSWDAKQYGNNWAAWDVPRHLYHFTKKDIEMLFSKFGFRLEKVIPMRFDSFYVSLLSQKIRTGDSNLISGFINGLLSNLSADKNGYSSQIYVFRSNKLID